MNYVIVLVLFNLTTGAATVRQEPTLQICEAEKASALKQMHLHAKDGTQYSAECLYSKTFVTKRDKA